MALTSNCICRSLSKDELTLEAVDEAVFEDVANPETIHEVYVTTLEYKHQ